MTLGRARIEAITLLALACLLAGYLWRSRHLATTSEREARATNVLPTFAAMTVRKIAISAGDATEVMLSRERTSQDLHDYRLGGQDLAEATEVDRAEVASLLRTLDFAAFVRTLEQSQIPDDAFDTRAGKITLDVEMDSVSYRVTVGGPAAHPPEARYARTTGDDGTNRAGVVPDSFAAALTKDARELRGRLLFPHAKSQTKLLEIRGPSGQTKLVADPLGFSVSQSPVPATGETSGLPEIRSRRADPARTDGLFFQLARAGMDAYPKTRVPTTTPLVVVQVPESGPETRVEVGGECPDHPELVQVVRTAPDQLLGCTAAGLVDALAPRDLTLRGPWPLAVDEIDHIVITGHDKTIDLIRDGAAFRLLAPKPDALSLERGNQYLEDLTNLSLDDAPCEGSPAFRVRIVGHPEGSSGGRELAITLLEAKDRASGERTILRREDDGACFLLGERARWLLDPTATWYESLDVFNVAPSDVTSFSSSGPKLAREEVRNQDGALVLVGGEIDGALLEATLRTLSPLRAVRIAERRPQGAWDARFELRIEAKSSGPYSLRIGPRVRGGYLAELAGRSADFVLAPEIVRTLETSLASRKPAQWNPESFSELTVTARGLTYRFRRVGSELVPTGDAPRELGPALLGALGMLIPISAVREGEGPSRGASMAEDLLIEGRYDAEGGQTRHLTVRLGTRVLLADQSLQIMTIDDRGPAYYVDRTAVLAVLDLL